MGIFHKAVVVLNTLIGLSSTGIFLFALITIVNFDNQTEALFSRGDFAWLMVAGVLGVIVAVLGCLGARDPVARYNLLFVYFFLVSLLLGSMIIGFYFYRVFVRNLEASADGAVESAFRIESAKEFNDLLLSVFVFCCSGCPDLEGFDCVRDIEPEEGFEGNCNLTNVAPLGADVEADCFVPTVCNRTQRDVNNGLGQGCTINAPFVPSYELGDNFCIFFSEFATNKNSQDIVGPTSANGCGGGDPAEFVKDVFEFMNKNYFLIASLWVISVIFIFLAWFGALLMLLCPHKYDPEEVKLKT